MPVARSVSSNHDIARDPIAQTPRAWPLPALVVAGLIFVGSAVGSAVVGYYVEMGLDAMHEALAEDEEEEAEEEPEAKRH